MMIKTFTPSIQKLIISLVLVILTLLPLSAEPDLNLLAPEGWPQLQQSLAGKLTLYVFWATTCEPCVEEMPDLVKLHQAYRNQGFEIVAISTDPPDRHQSAKEFLDRVGAEFPRYFKAPGSDVRFRQAIHPDYGPNPFAILNDDQANLLLTLAEAHNLEEWKQIISPHLSQDAGKQNDAATLSTNLNAPVQPPVSSPVVDQNPSTGQRGWSIGGLNLFGGKADQTTRTPFRVEQPSVSDSRQNGLTLTVPIVCDEEAHLILSTVQLNNFSAADVEMNSVRARKVDYYYMPVRDETEEILMLPGKLDLVLTLSGEQLPKPIDLELTFQGCTDGLGGSCFPPDYYRLQGTLQRGTEGLLQLANLKVVWTDPLLREEPDPADFQSLKYQLGRSSQQPQRDAAAEGVSQLADATTTAGMAGSETVFTSRGLKDPGLVEKAIARSLWLVLGLAFLGGILTSLTPCVYPMIPATVAIFGAKEVKSRWAACSLAATYVMGVALSYSTLGIVAAAIGTVFGNLIENPWAVSVVATFYVFLGLSMLDVFTFYLPSSWATKASVVNRKGYLGAFLMGLVSSIVFAPCGEPILLGILGWVAKTRSFMLGFWLLFVYAWGIGVLFFIIATFSNSLQYLPKAGMWMVAIKDFFGVLLLGLALFWLRFVIPPEWLMLLTTCYFLGVAAFLHTRNEGLRGWSRGLLSLAMMLALLTATVPLNRWLDHVGFGQRHNLASSGVGLVDGHYRDPNLPSIVWNEGQPLTDLETARQQQKPVVVDYITNVCPKCDLLEEQVFSHPKVVKAMQRFYAVRVNLSNPNAEIRQLSRGNGIYTAPVIEFYDSTGRLQSELTIADVVSAEDFLATLAKIR